MTAEEAPVSPWWSASRHADIKPFLRHRGAITRALRTWFESKGFTLTIVGGNNQSAHVNTVFRIRLVVAVTALDPLEPVDGGQVTFTAPASGANAVLAFRFDVTEAADVGTEVCAYGTAVILDKE